MKLQAGVHLKKIGKDCGKRSPTDVHLHILQTMENHKLCVNNKLATHYLV